MTVLRVIVLLLLLHITPIRAQELEKKHTFGFQLSLANHEDDGSGEVGDVVIVFQQSGGPHLNIGTFYSYKLSNNAS